MKKSDNRLSNRETLINLLKMNEQSFKDYYSEKLSLFESYLKKSFPVLPKQVALLKESMQYSLYAGGKRLRPILIMTTAECGGIASEIPLPYACAIEYIHTYSLIHDDLPCMDDDDLRRGKPTNHIQYGEALALLAGDALLTHSFSLLSSRLSNSVSQDQQLRILSLVAEKAGVFGMVSGQVADIDENKKGDSLEWLQFIHSHKTGALITVCIQIGSILAGFEENEYNALTIFGEEIGKCFQIQDDILDEIGDKAKLGKNPGSDRENDTLTYPKIFGLDKSRLLANQSYEKALDNLCSVDKDISRLKQLAQFILKRDH